MISTQFIFVVGTLKSVFGSYGSNPGQLNQTRGITIINSSLVIADLGNFRINFFDFNGKNIM